MEGHVRDGGARGLDGLIAIMGIWEAAAGIKPGRVPAKLSVPLAQGERRQTDRSIGVQRPMGAPYGPDQDHPIAAAKAVGGASRSGGNTSFQLESAVRRVIEIGRARCIDHGHGFNSRGAHLSHPERSRAALVGACYPQGCSHDLEGIGSQPTPGRFPTSIEGRAASFRARRHNTVPSAGVTGARQEHTSTPRHAQEPRG